MVARDVRPYLGRLSIFLIGALVVLAFPLSGCSWFGGSGGDTVHLKLRADKDLNACGASEANALRMRVYQLRLKDQFEQQPLTDLWNGGKEILGDELVEIAAEIVLLPSDSTETTIQLRGEAEYLAILGNFCNPRGEQRRWVIHRSSIGDRVVCNVGSNFIIRSDF